MEWISVKDRLPENEKWVTVGNNKFGVFIGQYFSSLGEFACKDILIEKVTHWMPLPKPPKK